jgi:pentatricopeptide repeat protein
MAVAYARLARYDKAESWFQKALAREHPPNVLYNYALMRKDQGRRDEALSLLRDFLAIADPGHPLRASALRLIGQLGRSD